MTVGIGASDPSNPCARPPQAHARWRSSRTAREKVPSCEWASQTSKFSARTFALGPLLGDLFDAPWKSNQKNVALLG